MTGDRPPTDAEALEATPTDLTLADVLAAAAEDTGGVVTTAAHAATTFAAGSPPAMFAALSGDRAEFRLDPLVARAALRTPDATPSTRGPDWVTFAPAVLDDGAVDRAEAWFLSAHRRVTAAGRSH
ncbi:MAG TPA: hypothetical protein VID95_12345 [Candidatus Limnocylindrales bacterium]|jgi:hypothetical protein